MSLSLKKRIGQLGAAPADRPKLGVRDITQFWEEVGAEDVPWLRPHLTDLTSETLRTRKVMTAKVDQNNPIWLEAPLRRLRMQMTQQTNDAAGTVKPAQPLDPLEIEASAFRRIACVLRDWDSTQVKDPEQFVITLQQVLKHAVGVTPSPDLGGLSLLMHVMSSSNIDNIDLLLDSWVFAMFEFDELVAQLRPLVRFLEEVNSATFKKFLKTALIFFQGQLPSEKMEGFNLYLLGEMGGGLLREMLLQFSKYDPDEQLPQYIVRTIAPLAEAASSLIEARTDRTSLAEIHNKMQMCRLLLTSPSSSPGVKDQLHTFLSRATPVVEKLMRIDVNRMASYLGFHGAQPQRQAPRAPGAPPPPPQIGAGAGLPPPPPAPPAPAAAGPAVVIPAGVPPPAPPLPPGGVFAAAGGVAPPPPAAGVVPPPPPPLPEGGLFAALASGHQPRLFPAAQFDARKFFVAMCNFCRVMGKAVKDRKRRAANKSLAGQFQPWRVKNYLLEAVSPASLWGSVKQDHLMQLEEDIQDVLDDISATSGSSHATGLLTVVYMVKDLDCTPCGSDADVIESNVARLRWLIDNIFLLYPHLHGAEGSGVLYSELTYHFSQCGFDPQRRLALWETMLGFNNRFKERAVSTAEANSHLTDLVNNEAVKHLLVAVLMHQRQVGIDNDADEGKIGVCKSAARHFALLRAMVDNLCKNYKGILILDAVEQLLPSILNVQSKLKSTQECLTSDLDAILEELESDERRRKEEGSSAPQSPASPAAGGAPDLTQFVVEGVVCEIDCSKVPRGSMLHALATTASFCVDDGTGRIPIEGVTELQFRHVADFYCSSQLPTGLSNAEWNDFKVACNFLGLEDIMYRLVEGDHIFYDKLTHFFHEAKRNVHSVTPVAKDAEDTLEVLSGLFRRIALIYEHIDTRSISNIFSAL